MTSQVAGEHRPPVRLRDLRDAGSADRTVALDRLLADCREQGHFLLDVVDLRDTIEQTYEQSRRFHELPDRARASIHNELHGGRGWVPPTTEPAYVAGTVARCQSFDLAQENPPTVVGGHRGVIGPNIWPDPDLLPAFQPVVYGLYLQLRAVAATLFRALGEALGLDPAGFAALDTALSPSLMRLLHYRGRPLSWPRPEREVGISTHTDFEAFTLMHQSAPGLQLCRPDGRWIDAPAAEDSLIVIVGDMLERLTNGHFVATPHRVPDGPGERYSIILFCALDAEAVVEPMAPFDRAPARYEPVTQVAHTKGEVAAAEANRDRLELG